MTRARWARRLLPGALLLAGAVAAVASIPFYQRWIVATYAVLWVVLSAAVLRGWRVGVAGRRPAALVVAAAGAATYLVPSFTYLAPSPAATLRAGVALGTVAVAVVLAAAPRRYGEIALALAAVVFVAGAATVIHLDPAPHIDVWYTLQGAADATVHGRDMYTQVWPASPGLKDAFTYLPWTAVLLAPAKLWAGDVRWGLVGAQLLAAGALVAMWRPRRPDAAVAAAVLLLLLPGTLTQIEQAWTEPLIFLLVGAALLAVQRGRVWLAVVLFALALAGKQHIVLLLPLLAAWRPFGVRRVVVTAGAGAALVLPWAVWNLGAMWHDTVTLLVGFHPIRFADTLYLAAIHELGWTPPFWLSGTLVLLVVAGCALAVRRLDPSPARFAVFCAVTLFGANLLNKQAFYNQFWLVAALVLLAWPADPADPAGVEGAVRTRSTTLIGAARGAGSPASPGGSS